MFDTFDYLVFILILLLTVLIGLHHTIHVKLNIGFLKRFARKSQTSETNRGKSADKEKLDEYVVANSTVGAWPVALSLLATYFSATSVLGIPAEVYTFGIQYWLFLIGIFINLILGAFITGPFFAKFDLTSIFQYLEIRFNSKTVRIFGTTFYILRMFIGTAIYIYGPSASLTTFTKLDDFYAIALIGFVATIYTTIGGIKGVIYTDAFQVLVMFTAVFVVIGKGLFDIGGIGNLFETSSKGGRLNLFDFNMDPFIRQSFWPLVIGNTLTWLLNYSVDQQMLQRFKASKSKRTAQKAMLLNIPGMGLLFSSCCFVGLILYSVFSKCDPLTMPGEKLSSANKILNYYVLKNVGPVIPGFAGLFLASIFSAAMSSVSSTLSGMGTILMHDYLKAFKYFQKIDHKRELQIIKLLVILCGLLSTCLAFMVSRMDGNLVQISNSLNGAIAAPLIGLFILGCLFSFTNAAGVCIGAVFGAVVACWICIGASIMKPPFPKLPMSIEQCNQNNISSLSTNIFGNASFKISNLEMDQKFAGFNKIYTLSYMWFTGIGILVTVLVGILASILTGGCKSKLRSKKDLVIVSMCDFCMPKQSRCPEAPKSLEDAQEILLDDIKF